MRVHDGERGTVDDGIELAEVVGAVRDGLVEAAGRGAGKGLRFELGEIHMEFMVEVRRDARARGGVKAWVVDAGAEAGLSTARTHKVSFSLKPRDTATGQDWLIAADDEGDVSGFSAAARD
ncbi:trypco2 family protein [Streptomyces griseorubiginosus]|uniref:trypco2 family protein n=1 Tax=Streptomyces griseorubiginosus TaxID=67304 RepID=UPI0033AA5016